MRRLVVNPGTAKAQEFELKPGSTLMGRGDHNNLVFNEVSVSGSHCEVIVQSGGAVWVRDLGSTNGTFINNRPVLQAKLEHGQILRLGSVCMLYEGEIGEAVSHVEAPAPPPKVAVRTQPAPPPIPAPAPVHAPPPLPVSAGSTAFAPAVAVGMAAEPVKAANLHCRMHPKSPARYFCMRCNRGYCELCVGTHRAGGVVSNTCRSCGGECVPVQVRYERPVERGFFERLPSAFMYPIRGDGIILVGSGTVLYFVIEVAGFFARYAGYTGFVAILMLAVLGTGYLLSYMRRILTSSAMGEETMPDWPEFSGFGEMIALCLQFGLVLLISFGPAALLALRLVSHSETWAAAAMFPALCWGCLYLPMAFLAFSMLDSVIAANPLVVVPSILRVPKEYIVTAILFGLILLVRWGIDALVGTVSQDRLKSHGGSELLLLFGGRALANLLSLYLLAVNMRLLGLLYISKKNVLGWFNR